MTVQIEKLLGEPLEQLTRVEQFDKLKNFFKKWPSCKVEASPEMMNDFSSISYEIEHILEEVPFSYPKYTLSKWI